MTERPESLVVIGGGVIGMGLPKFYNSLGTNVTVIRDAPRDTGDGFGDISRSRGHLCEGYFSHELESSAGGGQSAFRKRGTMRQKEENPFKCG